MIRRIREEDLSAVAEIEQELFDDHPWTRKDLEYEYRENPYAQFLVLEEEDRVIGYADLWILFDQAQIANIAVRKTHQKRGYGQALMDEMIRRAVRSGCENITLEVRVSNTAAVSLYEKNGFIRAAVRRNYYDDGEDAWLMIKPVGGMTYDSIDGN